MNQKIDLKSAPMREIIIHTLKDKTWFYFFVGISLFCFLLLTFANPMMIFFPMALLTFSLASLIASSFLVGLVIALGISSIILERMYRKLRFYEKVFVTVAKQYEKDPDFATKIEHAHNTIPCLEIRYMLKGILDDDFWVKNAKKVNSGYAVTINKSLLDEILRIMMENKSELAEVKAKLEQLINEKSEKEQEIGEKAHAHNNIENTKSLGADEKFE